MTYSLYFSFKHKRKVEGRGSFKEGEGREGKLEVKHWQKRKKMRKLRFCQSFTSNFPSFPSTFHLRTHSLHLPHFSFSRSVSDKVDRPLPCHGPVNCFSSLQKPCIFERQSWLDVLFFALLILAQQSPARMAFECKLFYTATPVFKRPPQGLVQEKAIPHWVIQTLVNC